MEGPIVSQCNSELKVISRKEIYERAIDNIRTTIAYFFAGLG